MQQALALRLVSTVLAASVYCKVVLSIEVRRVVVGLAKESSYLPVNCSLEAYNMDHPPGEGAQLHDVKAFHTKFCNTSDEVAIMYKEALVPTSGSLFPHRMYTTTQSGILAHEIRTASTECIGSGCMGGTAGAVCVLRTCLDADTEDLLLPRDFLSVSLWWPLRLQTHQPKSAQDFSLRRLYNGSHHGTLPRNFQAANCRGWSLTACTSRRLILQFA